MTIADILRDSNYSISLFTDKEINQLEADILFREVKGKKTPYLKCVIRNKEIKLNPEEIVRQLYVKRLINLYKYPQQLIQFEVGINFGIEVKRADIVVYDKNRQDAPYIIVELKKPKLKEGKEQLKSYCNATGAPIGIWSNGDGEQFYHRQDPNFFSELSDLPYGHENLDDFLKLRNQYTILDLLINDKLKEKSLMQIVQELEDEVLANAGVDVFEECFKLIFTKLYDEKQSGEDITTIQKWLEFNPEISLEDFKTFAGKSQEDLKTIKPKDDKEKKIIEILQGAFKKFRKLQFRNIGTDKQVKDNFEELFLEAQGEWKGIFPPSTQLSPRMTPSHTAICMSYLQNIKLFNSNLEVVDEAFEYLVNKSNKGEKGQYFTPRYVIDMCVKMLNPNPEEYMIDTASGSCGFPVHTIFKVWSELNPDENHLFTAQDKTKEQIKYVREKVFAIDFDDKAVRVGKTLNIIAGDGETNVLLLNSLDFESWNEAAKDSSFQNDFGKGFATFEKLRENKKEINGRKDYRSFQFDILMANPPFAGDIKDSKIITKYELGKKYQTKTVKEANETKKLSVHKGWAEKISRDILFIERNLNMLKPGGRMAVVLPQGRFNNTGDKTIRDFVSEHCRILGVVGLHGNCFKPHTGTKTSVMFVQKWDDELCPRKEDYDIFFATQKIAGKDSGGEKVYETEILPAIEPKYKIWKEDVVDEDTGETVTIERREIIKEGRPEQVIQKTDRWGHPIVKHDLFNTDKLTQDGIAEAFIEFAKKERLSFFL
jgi:type I restriction enzyme M protein